MTPEGIFCSFISLVTIVKLFIVSRKIDELSQAIERAVPRQESQPDITGDLERRLLDIQQSRYAKNYFRR